MLHKVVLEQSINVHKNKKSLVLISFNKKISINFDDNVLVYLKKKERELYIKFVLLPSLKTKECFFKKILAKHTMQINKVKDVVFSLVKKPKSLIFLIGLGYKIELFKNAIFLKLGFSHTIKILLPIEIQAYCSKESILLLKSLSKAKLFTFMGILQKYKKLDQYKSRGISLNWEHKKSKKITKRS